MYPEEDLTPGPGTAEAVVVAVLGEVATRRDGGALVPLPGTRARSLLVALAANLGRSRSAQALIDDVWGDQPPRSPMNALHTQMSRLRGALPDGAIEISPAGYRLTLAKDEVDLTLARVLEQRAQQSYADGTYINSLDAIAEARALWRGEPGADLPGGELAADLATTAEARRAALDAAEIAVRTAMGDWAGALAPASAAAARAPLDEQAHLTLMHVFAGLGRPNDALEVFVGIRARLADQLGADPGPALTELNTAILRGEHKSVLGASREQRDQASQHSWVEPRSVGLRAAPNPLLGRAGDLDALDGLLDTARVVTVLGPGGTGKTRVANEIGLRRSDRMPVALIELASLRSGEDVTAAISSALGLADVERVRPGSIAGVVHTPMQRLHETLSARPSLLILDNCEHLIESVAEVVAELIATCEPLTVLTTSRSPLIIMAESVYPLAPLRIDEHGSPATALFAARARAVRPTARLDPAEVAQLCRTLDGLPLAIELAAARMRTMSVEEINAGLNHRFALLRSGDRTSPERHRTLHAVIEWSWNLLDPSQQAALRRLCRFPAGFTLPAARAVAGWDAVKDVDDAVDGLVNQSLLTVIEAPSGIRYRMLETVREFGEEQLTLADEETAVMRRMTVWAEDFALDARSRYLSANQIGVLASIDAEQDNLLAVLRYGALVESRRTVFVVFSTLTLLWMLKGQNSETITWAPRVLALGLPEPDEVDVPTDPVLFSMVLAGLHRGMIGEVRTVSRARVVVRKFLRQRSDGLPNLRYSAELFCSPPNGRGVARKLAEGVRSADARTRASALIYRANLRENNGDIAGSKKDALCALPIAESIGDIHSVAMMCQHLGSVYGQTAEYEESVRYYRRAVDEFVRLQAIDESFQHRGYLAVSLIGAGHIEDARHEIESMLASGRLAREPAPTADGFNQTLAAVAAATAELKLAEGDIDGGLAEYRRTLVVLDWPASERAPGPLGWLLACAAIAAHVLHGRAGEVDCIARELVQTITERWGQFKDFPMIGCTALAVGGHRLAHGHDDDETHDLLALATRVHPRQDFPSLRMDRHIDPADAAFGRVGRMIRSVAAEEIVERLRRI